MATTSRLRISQFMVLDSVLF